MKASLIIASANSLTILSLAILSCLGVSPAKANDVVSFSSYNFPNSYIRHRNGFGELTVISSPLDRQDASFRMVKGLAGDCVSLESVNYPGYFLRHQNARIKLSTQENTDLFRQDATFCIYESNLAPASFVKIKSYNFPDYYLRHRDGHLYLEKGSSDLFQKDSTFRQRAALSN